MDDGRFQALPEGIATMPAGPALAVALESVDPARVSPADTATLLSAQRRQLNRTQARFALTLRECALADPDVPGGREAEYGEFSADEPRARLSWSRTMTCNALYLAQDAIVRLPPVFAAWQAGDLDEARVKAICRWTGSLSDAHAGAVAEVVVPEAAGSTMSALIERLQELATALDPEWARKLYDAARLQRRVRARRAEDGTATLSGLDLPLDAAVRSVAHVSAMAAKAQAAGHPGLIDTIRADIFLALLSPRWAGEDDDTIVAAVVAAADVDDRRGGPAPDPADAPPDARPAAAAPGPGPEPGRVPESEPVSEDGVGEPAAGTRPLPRQARVELRVGLTTLLGLDDKPARLPGWGVVHGDLARRLAADHTRGEWRVAVSGPDGALVATLLARRRPTDHPSGPPLAPGAPRAIVELHVSESALAELDPAEHPAWSGLLTDLQHQLGLWQRARAENAVAADADRAAEQATASAPDPADAPDQAGAAAARRVAERRRARAREALRRFPSPALARWIQMRDRFCSFGPCRTTAAASEIDHTLAVHDHGLTVPSNLGPACAHDHRLKHHGRWRLRQPRPGHFVWTSHTGHDYPTGPRSVLPDLPEPRPHPDPAQRSWAEPGGCADNGPVWDTHPYPGPAGPPPERERPDRSGTDPTGADPDPPPF